MALSEEAGPSVARILIRRRRLIVCFRALAADLARLKVDVIVTGGSAATRPSQEATITIPIVMAQVYILLFAL
jgi:ABC-type uncharacterized transport system substrate-binding protein